MDLTLVWNRFQSSIQRPSHFSIFSPNHKRVYCALPDSVRQLPKWGSPLQAEKHPLLSQTSLSRAVFCPIVNKRLCGQGPAEKASNKR